MYYNSYNYNPICIATSIAEFRYESSLDPLSQYYEVRCVVVGTTETKVAIYIIDGAGNVTSVQDSCPAEYCSVNTSTTITHSHIVTHNISVLVERSDDAPETSALFKPTTSNNYGDLVFLCQAEDLHKLNKHLIIQGTTT